MASNRNLLVQYSDVFILNNVEVPDTSASAVLVKDLINTALATKGYTLGGREIAGVIMIPAGPISFFHKEVKDAHDLDPNSVDPSDESGVIAGSASFDGYECVDWWKNTYVYVQDGQTGYGAGGLTVVQFILQTLGNEE